MGSITSTPKLPPARQPQPVYIQAQAPITVPTYTAPAPLTAPMPTAESGPLATSGPAPTSTATPAHSAAAQSASASGLLQRSRGVFSTVLTGFRGLLNDTLSSSPRKALLGE